MFKSNIINHLKNILIFFIITLFETLHPYNSFANINNINNTNNDNFNILIFNSYNSQNQWEHLILESIQHNLSDNPKINISVEYLDSKTSFSEEYKSKLSDLLNLKYNNFTFDIILTLDDEALEFARDNRINSDSIFHKTPIFFIGVNKRVSLSDTERNFISGVIELEDNLRFINLVSSLQSNLNKIFILLDDSTFSYVIKENIETIQPLINSSVELVFSQNNYLDDILKILPSDSTKESAIILVGEFKDKSTNLYINLEDTIRSIKNKTNIPIYTKLEPYIYAGAIGGIVDVANHHGSVASDVTKKLLSGVKMSDIPLVYNSLDITMFNYDSLNFYNINPLLLPKESIIINKAPYDFLLPKPIKIFTWTIILLSFVLFFYLIFLAFKYRKHAKIKEDKLKKLIETEKLKSTFISTMSHEFRTPINIILSTSQLLTLKIDSGNIDSTYLKPKISSIVKNSNRLLKVVNNIIDVTRLESGFLTLNYTYTNIISVVENTVTSIIEYANQFDLEVIFDTESEEINTYFDVSKIERCILNLLSNSIKFTPPGGRISIDIVANTVEVTIKISDTGVGISKEDLPHIFDRFYQTENTFSRTSEGSGLGLFIVKGLINLHKGVIYAESDPEIGSTFTIILPILPYNSNNLRNDFFKDDISRLASIELSDILDKY